MPRDSGLIARNPPTLTHLSTLNSHLITEALSRTETLIFNSWVMDRHTELVIKGDFIDARAFGDRLGNRKMISRKLSFSTPSGRAGTDHDYGVG